ncbi:Domain of unknown function DUF4338 [Acididesulfobacillus acetoxydans]|uniref:DUF4338 domain-containing protein n=2 Tax=Acididesulfobacillus acetoxydans TaxID=1561005 RepID=A0A8S0Y4W9_9FIRM|nr:DUF4338 domain-containing protein [Acididesulfobacillus acetoxydans]CAA7600844.1 Domain of unknown function DUF4338 [Acididesulfobacillus acetoxydans]CAA7601363.1 Domain of unknown function DUF4338 [Acididesulfobacillus acetoxydans]CAA7603375.1 Domain of unknown function DUF4338 [Acididesulfobacillus acetoxydans]
MISVVKARGRTFSAEDLELIRSLIRQGNLNRQRISQEVCRALNWRKPDGGLKDMSCRVALLRLHRDGIIELPPPLSKDNNRLRPIQFTPASDPGEPITVPLHHLGSIRFIRVSGSKQSRFWNELIERYHYLGYTRLPGAQIRYLIYTDSGVLLGAIGFSSPAWALRPRDELVGWTKEQRLKHLNLVVNNSRFLLLPWVHVKNLASKILSLTAKRLPQEWQATYGHTPVLLETFVDKERYRGTCYKAANWSYVGETQGRGKWDRLNEYKLPVKSIYLYPLHKNFRQILAGSD